jgi:hypothetical protein
MSSMRVNCEKMTTRCPPAFSFGSSCGGDGNARRGGVGEAGEAGGVSGWLAYSVGGVVLLLCGYTWCCAVTPVTAFQCVTPVHGSASGTDNRRQPIACRTA